MEIQNTNTVAKNQEHLWRSGLRSLLLDIMMQKKITPNLLRKRFENSNIVLRETPSKRTHHNFNRKFKDEQKSYLDSSFFLQFLYLLFGEKEVTLKFTVRNSKLSLNLKCGSFERTTHFDEGALAPPISEIMKKLAPSIEEEEVEWED